MKAVVIKVLRGTIALLETAVTKLETPPSRTSGGKISNLPGWVKAAVLASLALVTVWGLTTFFPGQPAPEVALGGAAEQETGGLGEQGSRGAGEQGSRGAGEQGTGGLGDGGTVTPLKPSPPLKPHPRPSPRGRGGKEGEGGKSPRHPVSESPRHPVSESSRFRVPSSPLV